MRSKYLLAVVLCSTVFTCTRASAADTTDVIHMRGAGAVVTSFVYNGSVGDYLTLNVSEEGYKESGNVQKDIYKNYFGYITISHFDYNDPNNSNNFYLYSTDNPAAGTVTAQGPQAFGRPMTVNVSGVKIPVCVFYNATGSTSCGTATVSGNWQGTIDSRQLRNSHDEYPLGIVIIKKNDNYNGDSGTASQVNLSVSVDVINKTFTLPGPITFASMNKAKTHSITITHPSR